MQALSKDRSMYAKDGSDMTNKPMMPALPLSLVKAGETVKVSRVKGGDDMPNTS